MNKFFSAVSFVNYAADKVFPLNSPSMDMLQRPFSLTSSMPLSKICHQNLPVEISVFYTPINDENRQSRKLKNRSQNIYFLTVHEYYVILSYPKVVLFSFFDITSLSSVNFCYILKLFNALNNEMSLTC